MKEWLICDDCGKQAEDAEETLCPYAQDIDGEDVPCVLCTECYNNRCDEI